MPSLDSELDFESTNDQFESEDDSDLGTPSLLEGVVVTDSDWTSETVLNQVDKGNIQLNPRFQRREAWNDKRKSKFIESVLLGLPIPQLVLAEQKGARGKYLVIDGKQRLLSLMRFAGSATDGKLKLSGLEVRSDLNGKTWDDLQSSPELADDVAAFENAQIRTTTIRGWNDERALFLIFHRLNSGSVALSPQELRHALHPGPFIDYVFDFTESSDTFIRILGKNGKPDFRMRDVELLIRFIGFKVRLASYRGDLKNFWTRLLKNRITDGIATRIL